MSNYFLENLVINAQKIPATNSGTKNSEFSIFINLLTNQIVYDEKTIKNYQTRLVKLVSIGQRNGEYWIIVLEFVVGYILLEL